MIGFLLLFGSLATTLYDAALSVVYLLMVRYNWRAHSLYKLERFLHALIVPTTLALAIPPWPLGLYNYDWDICWIEAFPAGCEVDDEFDCLRGGGSDMYFFRYVSTGLLLLSMILSISCMVSIYLFVRGLEARNNRYLSQYSVRRSRGVSSRTTPGDSSNTISAQTGSSDVAPGDSLIMIAASVAAPPPQLEDQISSNEERRSARQEERERRRSMFRKTRLMGQQGLRYACTNIIASAPLLVYMFVPYTPILLTLSSCSIALHGFYYLVFFLRDRETMRTSYGRLWKWLLYKESNSLRAASCRCTFVFCFFCRCIKKFPSGCSKHDNGEVQQQ